MPVLHSCDALFVGDNTKGFSNLV